MRRALESQQRSDGAEANRSPAARLASGVWLAFLAYPLYAAYTRPEANTLHEVVVSVAAGLICASYLGYAALPDITRLERKTAGAGLVALLAATVTFLVLYDGPYWSFSYLYCIWPMIMMARRRVWATVTISAFALGCAALAGLSLAWLGQLAILITGTSASILCFAALIEANAKLRRASAQVAEMAVAEERLRFARDLHELLGQSLSVVVLKSQVASRLAERDAKRAAVEMAEIEQVARRALQEVREAVNGCRRPSLCAELRGASTALAAAGVSLSQTGALPELPEQVDTLFAWALREAVTNVIRHAKATSCTVKVFLADGFARLEVFDDGAGGTQASGGGNGLKHLSERLRAGGGILEARPAAGGGYLLRAAIPLALLAPSASTAAGAAR